jgi:hypothetical protein
LSIFEAQADAEARQRAKERKQLMLIRYQLSTRMRYALDRVGHALVFADKASTLAT